MCAALRLLHKVIPKIKSFLVTQNPKILRLLPKLYASRRCNMKKKSVLSCIGLFRPKPYSGRSVNFVLNN